MAAPWSYSGPEERLFLLSVVVLSNPVTRRNNVQRTNWSFLLSSELLSGTENSWNSLENSILCPENSSQSSSTKTSQRHIWWENSHSFSVWLMQQRETLLNCRIYQQRPELWVLWNWKCSIVKYNVRFKYYGSLFYRCFICFNLFIHFCCYSFFFVT